MDDMERRKFEDAFKDAFQNAGVNPSEKAWTNIELDLEKNDGGSMKRQLAFYKMLAAASLTFALSVVGIGYYMIANNYIGNVGTTLATSASHESQPVVTDKENGADQNTETSTLESSSNTNKNQSDINEKKKSIDENVAASALSKSPSNNGNQIALDEEKNDSRNLASKKLSSSPVMNEKENLRAETIIENDQGTANTNIINRDQQNTERTIGAAGNSNISLPKNANVEENNTRALPPLYQQKSVALNIAKVKKEEPVADPVALMFARLNQLERELAQEDDKRSNANQEKLWTSVGFAAGGFNTISSSVTPTATNQSLLASNSSAPSQQAKASGIAYSMGVSMGTRISNRWVVQGGVNYATQMSDYTANEAVGTPDLQNFKAASLNTFARTADAPENTKIVPTSPYTVNSSVRFMSVPVQAGYLLMNKQMGIQLNAGVSTDLFLQNTIDSEGGNLQRTTQGSGSDSPYRTVNFSGLFGTELSYRFNPRYRVALNPGLRYPFNSIYKSDIGIQATPLTFDIGLKFRYIFK